MNSTELQEIKNYLFGHQEDKKLNYYTVLGFENQDDFTQKFPLQDKNKIRRLVNASIFSSYSHHREKCEKALKKFNHDNPSDQNYINKGIKKEGLSFVIDLKKGASSYIANLEKEEALKGNGDITKIMEDKNSNLYRFKCALDYVESIEKSLGFSLEPSLQENVSKLILLKRNDKLRKKYEIEIKRFNRNHPSNEKYTNQNIKKEGLSFLVDLKQGAVSYITNLEKEEALKGNGDITKIMEDKNSNLYRFKCALDYVESIEKSIGLSLECYMLLSKTREDSIKILSNTALRKTYDEGIAEGKLNPLISYEECLDYQQGTAKNSHIEKSEAIEEINKELDCQKQKSIRLNGNIITMSLWIYGDFINQILKISNLKYGIDTVKMEEKGVKALLDKDSSKETKADDQNYVQNTEKEQNNEEKRIDVARESGLIGNVFNRIVNWYSGITNRMVGFTRKEFKFHQSTHEKHQVIDGIVVDSGKYKKINLQDDMVYTPSIKLEKPSSHVALLLQKSNNLRAPGRT